MGAAAATSLKLGTWRVDVASPCYLGATCNSHTGTPVSPTGSFTALPAGWGRED